MPDTERMVERGRADALRNDAVVLRAAEELVAADPASVTMAAVAQRAGVGKGTLYRAFGDRAGLLGALMADRAAAVLDELQAEASSPVPAADGVDRLERVMTTLARFKLDHRGLHTAIEADRYLGPYAAARYDDWHRLVASALAAARGADVESVGFEAHTLLAAIRSDLVEHLLGTEGVRPEEYLEQLRAHVRRVAQG